MNAFTKTAVTGLGEVFGLAPEAGRLWALKAAYAKLEQCIVQLEAAASREEPDMVLLAAARFRLSQASLARRHLLHNACGHLLSVSTAAEAETIRSLQRQSLAYAAASTEHICNWPAARVERNWSAYKVASRAIRANMKQVMRAEQCQLLPLLARYEIL